MNENPNIEARLSFSPDDITPTDNILQDTIGEGVFQFLASNTEVEVQITVYPVVSLYYS